MQPTEAKNSKSSRNREFETTKIVGIAIILFLVFIWLFRYIFESYIFPCHIAKGGNFESFFNQGPYHIFMVLAFGLIAICLIVFTIILIKYAIISTLKLFFRKKSITNKHLAFSNIISILLVFLGLTYLSHLYFTNQIYYASRNDDVNVVSALLTRNPMLVNSKRQNGDTPLHMAAYAGHSKIVIILLDNGAMINEKNIEGNTPLYEAILFRHKEIVEILITRGARIDERNKSNETPLSWALKYGGPDIADLLRKHGAKE